MRRVDFTVEGQPYSKARPRVTSRGTYTPKAQKANADALAWEIKIACEHRAFQGSVAVGLVFYRSNRQAIDLDNMVKQVLDAANGVAWKDDSQVTRIMARKDFDAKRPRTVIMICDDEGTSFETPDERLREATCARCESTFKYMPYPSQPPPRHCSTTCKRTGVCANEECGRRFEKKDYRQRYCSHSCAQVCVRRRQRNAYQTRAAAQPKSYCQKCGKELKRRGAVLCREHWLENTHQRKALLEEA